MFRKSFLGGKSNQLSKLRDLLQTKFVSDEYKITCIDCPTGKYGDSSGLYLLKKCKQCEQGRYSNKTGLTNLQDCIRCPLGKYSLSYAMTSENDCKLCLTGKYKNNMMNLECSLCERGKYSLSGASSCTECSAGRIGSNLLKDKQTKKLLGSELLLKNSNNICGSRGLDMTGNGGRPLGMVAHAGGRRLQKLKT